MSKFWAVESVLDARDTSGHREYLVKWQGYNDKDNSWVRDKDLNAVMRQEAEVKFPVPSGSKVVGQSAKKKVKKDTPAKKASTAKSGVSSTGTSMTKKRKEATVTPADDTSMSSLYVTPTTSPAHKKVKVLTPTSSASSAGTELAASQSPPSSAKSSPKSAIKKQVNGSKRADYLSWDEYFMLIARLSANRSKDPNTQVGACIVSPEQKIVGIGYNGMPIGLSDDELPWNKSADFANSKYTYVCHAELNAILNRNSADLKDCSIYVDLFPCNECAKLIIQSRIKHVVYLRDKNPSDPKSVASRKMLRMANVSMRQFQSNRSVTLSLRPQ